MGSPGVYPTSKNAGAFGAGRASDAKVRSLVSAAPNSGTATYFVRIGTLLVDGLRRRGAG
jgi:hypothetical protein